MKFYCSENTFKQNLLHLLSELKTGPGGEMVDTLVSGASAAMHAGSSPVLGTNLVRRFLAGAASIFYRCLFANPLYPVFYSHSVIPSLLCLRQSLLIVGFLSLCCRFGSKWGSCRKFLLLCLCFSPG